MLIGPIIGGPAQSPGTAFDTVHATIARGSAPNGGGVEIRPVEPGSTLTKTDNSGARENGAAEKTSQRQAEVAAQQRQARRAAGAPQGAEARSVFDAIAQNASDVRDKGPSVSGPGQARNAKDALIESVSVVQSQQEPPEPREIDRFAPPNPLPTSDALKNLPPKPVETPEKASQAPDS